MRQGAVFGLLGPDGAGKSTLIRMLATVLAPDSGDALVFGDSVVHAHRRVTPRIGYMSQRFSMYPDLSVAENLEFFARIRGVPAPLRRTRAASLLESMGLAEFADRQAQHLSGGMKQKLMLASTLMHEPDLLLLDEPTTGVDPLSRREFWRIIADLQAAEKTVLVATPYMDEAERCTDIAFMDERPHPARRHAGRDEGAGARDAVRGRRTGPARGARGARRCDGRDLRAPLRRRRARARPRPAGPTPTRSSATCARPAWRSPRPGRPTSTWKPHSPTSPSRRGDALVIAAALLPHQRHRAQGVHPHPARPAHAHRGAHRARSCSCCCSPTRSAST